MYAIRSYYETQLLTDGVSEPSAHLYYSAEEIHAQQNLNAGIASVESDDDDGLWFLSSPHFGPIDYGHYMNRNNFV